MGKTAKIIKAFAMMATLMFCAWSTVRIVKAVQFNMNCTQYIKRAADANTVELAKEELAKAISYAERNNLTEGVVSIFLQQPKNDIGYWYKNLTESLTDEKQSGVYVTMPYGISIYPENVFYFWWGLLSSICCLGSLILLFVSWWFNWD